jgi:hypothetical protein
MYKNLGRKIAMMTKRMADAMQVRSVTTANGENPFRMAHRPKTGNTPRNTADDSAAIIPVLLRLVISKKSFFTVIGSML